VRRQPVRRQQVHRDWAGWLGACGGTGGGEWVRCRGFGSRRGGFPRGGCGRAGVRCGRCRKAGCLWVG